MTGIEERQHSDDIEFLKDNFRRLTSARNYELPSVYTEKVRYIDKELSPLYGRFSYDSFPYFRKIVDCFSPDSTVERVVVLKGAQIGATTSILEPVMLYNMGCRPSSILYVNPTADMAKKAMATKIERMIDSSGIRGLIGAQTRKAARSRGTGDTATAIEFYGGYLHAVGANSSNDFRAFSYKVVIVDEIETMADNLKGEGSIVELIEARTKAYSQVRKIYYGSTPATEQTSKIYPLFLEGDQQYYYVPCKHCGTMQKLEWAIWDDAKNKIGGIVWENDENFQPILETVGYKCPHCGGIMKNYDKSMIMKKGEWRATAKAAVPHTASFQINALYNPPGMYSWEDFVKAWAKCWDLKNNRCKDREAYKTFRNLNQGLPFREQNEQIRYERAMLHRRWGFIRRKVPNSLALSDSGSPVLVVFCSVDVQKDCLYVDVKGYSARGVTWTLDFFRLDGNTDCYDGVWNDLANFIDNAIFDSDDGKFYRIAATFVDSGHYTDKVYAFCARFARGVYAIKGTDWLNGGETFRPFAKETRRLIGLDLAFMVNTTKLKDRISMMMNVMQWDEETLQPDWYANFPDDFRDDYFRMFEAESKVEVYDKNTNKFLRTYWKAKEGADNHAFDTYVYNLAALEVFASEICTAELGLGCLSWEAFWDFAKGGAFYGEDKQGGK